MRKFLFVLASTSTMAMINPAKAQVYLPPNPGVAVAPGYVTPGYVAPGYAPGYVAPGYVAPRYTIPGSSAPGYSWREQRANEDWRNNTWREQQFDQDWRNNNSRTQRAMEDWRQRENYEQQRTPNNASDRGLVGTTPDPRYVGECAIGMSEETCRRRGQRYNAPNNAGDRGVIGSDGTVINRPDQTYGGGQLSNPPNNAGDRGIGSDGTVINRAEQTYGGGQISNPPINTGNRGPVGPDATNRAYVGECPLGLPLETCRARGLSINPLNNTSKSGATVGQKNNTGGSGYAGECAIGMSAESCGKRGQNPPR